MKELRNSFDKEATFENLEEAKKYYLPKENKPCKIEDYLGEDYKKFCDDYDCYKQEIKEAQTLEELAEVLTKWTDIFNNGSVYFVLER